MEEGEGICGSVCTSTGMSLVQAVCKEDRIGKKVWRLSSMRIIVWRMQAGYMVECHGIRDMFTKHVALIALLSQPIIRSFQQQESYSVLSAEFSQISSINATIDFKYFLFLNLLFLRCEIRTASTA